MKCDMCDKPAVVHEVILRNGVKQELHLCEKHAAEQGYALPGQPPLEKILQQFVMAWQTDENDEADLFSGTISQALMMMNGELVDLALSFGKGTYLDRVARSSRSENEKIEAIALATLSRKPSRTELSAVRKLMQDRVAGQPRGVDRTVAVRSSLQDLFWACLNSNEFILIH